MNRGFTVSKKEHSGGGNWIELAKGYQNVSMPTWMEKSDNIGPIKAMAERIRPDQLKLVGWYQLKMSVWERCMPRCPHRAQTRKKRIVKVYSIHLTGV
jgi:hypothetical protein